jgi:hypothetical protein
MMLRDVTVYIEVRGIFEYVHRRLSGFCSRLAISITRLPFEAAPARFKGFVFLHTRPAARSILGVRELLALGRGRACLRIG